jgi:hypothetical protein
MRASHLVLSPILSLLGAGVLGCGGGSAKPDAPIDAFACAQSGTLNVATALDFSQGGQANGAVSATGTQQLTVSVIVTSRSQPDRGFFILQVNNGGVYSTATGKAGRFETPPTPGSYPMDPDMNLGFGMDFVDGVIQAGNGTASAPHPTQIALLDTAGGTVRIDSFTPAAMPGMTSTIGATITNAKFKGYNMLPTGIDPAGNGCDITVQNLAFTGLSVKWQATAFPPIAPPPAQPDLAARPDLAVRPIDGATAVSADFQLVP